MDRIRLSRGIKKSPRKKILYFCQRCRKCRKCKKCR